VTIIDKGRILASGAIKDIKDNLRTCKTIAMRTLSDKNVLEKALLESPGVSNIRQAAAETHFDFQGDEKDIAAFLRRIISQDILVIECRIKEEGLEDIFMKITNSGH
jgi:ABC-type multidrug transport system ATPase subunit